MSVYVDDYQYPYNGMLLSHMVADTTAELHAMADAIGVQRRWVQNLGTWKEHYDVCRTKRRLAVQLGAIEVTTRQLAEIRRAKQVAPLPSAGVPADGDVLPSLLATGPHRST